MCDLCYLSVNKQIGLRHGKKVIGRRATENAANWFLSNIYDLKEEDDTAQGQGKKASFLVFQSATL